MAFDGTPRSLANNDIMSGANDVVKSQGQWSEWASQELATLIKAAGVDIFGFGDVSEGLHQDFWPMCHAIALGCALNRSDADRTVVFPDELAWKRLRDAAKAAAKFLRSSGYRFFSLPPAGVKEQTFRSALYDSFSHKVAATCSGLGWVGKNGLLVSPRFGTAVLWATVLTNAPLPTGRPLREGHCGACTVCADACPAGAVRGREWQRGLPTEELLDLEACRAHLASTGEKCGEPRGCRCLTACPRNFQRR